MSRCKNEQCVCQFLFVKDPEPVCTALNEAKKLIKEINNSMEKQKLKFTPEDFNIDRLVSPEFAAKIAQKKFDAWLEAQPVEYFRDQSRRTFGDYQVSETLDPEFHTHRARLVAIEEIEKKPCEHKDGYQSDVSKKWFCMDCNCELRRIVKWEEA